MSEHAQGDEAAAIEQPLTSIQQIQAMDFAAWQLIGRLDMALEQMGAMTDIRKAQRLARRMRNEIKASLVTLPQSGKAEKVRDERV